MIRTFSPSDSTGSIRLTSFVLLFLFFLPAQLPAASAVVTTTLLGAAVRILAGPEVDVHVLVPPGACPGHADITPGELLQLRTADLVLHHEFQHSLAEKWKQAGLADTAIVCCSASGALTIPERFVHLVEKLAPDAIARLGLSEDETHRRLLSFHKRLASETAFLRSEAAAASGTQVLAAEMQREFCAWAGLDPVATWKPLEGLTPADLSAMRKRCREHAVSVCMGNLQWGVRALEDLSRALGLEPVMLSNFPRTADEEGYFELLRQNFEGVKKAGVLAHPSTSSPAAGTPSSEEDRR